MLISIDGVNGGAVAEAARDALSQVGGGPGGISVWDASGVFGDLAAGGDEAGAPSARTLLLLYASDLMFRLRWEIEPALAEGKTVVAAPYVRPGCWPARRLAGHSVSLCALDRRSALCRRPTTSHREAARFRRIRVRASVGVRAWLDA